MDKCIGAASSEPAESGEHRGVPAEEELQLCRGAGGCQELLKKGATTQELAEAGELGMVHPPTIPSWLLQTVLSLPGEGRIGWGFMDPQAGSGTKINSGDVVGFWGQQWENGSPV